MKFRLFLAIAFAALGLKCTAQVADEPLRVMVKLKLTSSGSITMTGDLPLPSGITPPLTKAQTVDFVSTAIEIGKTYTVTLTGATSSSLVVAQPPGYTLLMGKTTDAPLARNKFTISASPTTLNVRLMAKSENLDMPVGESTSLRGSGIHWQVSLGKLRNGNPAGAISLIGSGIGQEAEPWAGFFNATALSYVTDSSGAGGDREVQVFRSPSGSIAQIRANEAYVDVAAAVAGDGFTGYWIKFYRRDQVGAPYPTTTFKGDPFTAYKVERLGPTKLRISKHTRNHQEPEARVAVSRTEWTTIERSTPVASSSYNFKWTVLDWNEATADTNANIRVREVTWSDGDALGNRVETYTTRYNGSVEIDSRVKRRVAFSDKTGEQFTNLEVGPDDSSKMSMDISYMNSQSTGPAKMTYGLVEKTTTNGGFVSSFTYNSSTDSLIGTVSTSSTTYLDGTSPQDSSVSEQIVADYDYDSSLSGFPPRLSGVQTSQVRKAAATGAVIGNQVIGKWRIEYHDVDPSNASRPAFIRAIRYDSASSGTTNDLISGVLYYREDVTDSLYRNQPRGIQRADGSGMSITYEHGTYNESTFAFSPGGTAAHDAIRISMYRGYQFEPRSGDLLFGSDSSLISPTYIRPFKSTKTDLYKDGNARVRRVVEFVLSSINSGATWDPIGEESYQYTLAGALNRKVDLKGGEYTANYVGHRIIDETLPSGESYSYQYDVNGRVWKITKAASPSDPNELVTEFAYDSADRVVSKKVYNAAAAAGTREELVSSWTFDDAGRIISSTSPDSGAVTYTYEPANNRFKVTYPAHSELTAAPYVYVSSYRDGRQKAIWGTGATKEAIEYKIETDGKLTTEVIHVGSGSDDSVPARADRSRWARVTRDWLGRPVTEVRPGPHTPKGKDLTAADLGQGVSADQIALLKSYTYSPGPYPAATGFLSKISETGLGDKLFKYSDRRELLEVGIDVTPDSPAPALTAGSSDRIIGSETAFAKIDGKWWLQTTNYTYGKENSSQKVILSTTRKRLSGYSATDPVKQESVEIDREGNLVTTKLEVERGTKRATLTVSTKGVKSQAALNDFVEQFENGLPRKRTGTDQNWEKLTYDELGRLKEESDSRIQGGIKQFLYKRGTTLVETVKARANNSVEDPSAVTWATVATSAYNDLGLPKTVTDAKGAVTYYKYNSLGRPSETWGTACHPEKTEYDAFGQPEKFYTFRGSGFAGASFPSMPTRENYSLTTLIYTPSGFLQNKTDDNDNGVALSYYLDGKIKTRDWARIVGTGSEAANKVRTTYTYAAVTRELIGVTYNDGTPGITLGYSRMGSVNEISDSTGTRSFGFDTDSPWRLEAEYLPAFFRNRVLTMHYQSPLEGGMGKLYGRRSGFTLGTLGDPGRFLSYYTEMGGQGRIDSVLSGFASSGMGQRFSYGYQAGSSLIGSITAKGNSSSPDAATTPSDFVTSLTYEKNRDMLEKIGAKWGDQPAGLANEFSYKTNLLGQRESVQQAGAMFTSAYGTGNPLYQRYGYNLRGELDSARTYKGTVPADAAQDASPLPGRQLGFIYDSAGNRTNSSRGYVLNDDSYAVNGLNQITGRDNKAISVSGVVSNADIAVANQAPARADNYWHLELSPGGSSAETRQIDIIANRDDGAGANLDSAYLDRRYVYFRPRAEVREHDLDGNLTSDGMWTYEWDAENRLKSMTQRPWVRTMHGELRKRLEFRYDYMGRRVSKIVKTTTSALDSDLTTDADWALASERRFVYDGWNLVAEFDPGLSTSANPEGDLIRSYTWGLDEGASLSRVSSGGALLQITDHISRMSYFPGYDGNGNVVSLTRAADGALVAEYEYGPFGEPWRQTGVCATLNPFRFGTKYTDDESGLVYYGMRYYEPRNGRFINRDPIGEAGGSNLYGFVGNSPVNHQDLLGLQIVIGGGVIGGGGGSYDGSDLTPGDVGGSTGGGVSVTVGGQVPGYYYGGASGGASGGGNRPKPQPGTRLDSIKNVTGYYPTRGMTAPLTSIGGSYATSVPVPSSSLITAQNFALRMNAPFPTNEEEIYTLTGAYRGAMINQEEMLDAVFLGVNIADGVATAGTFGGSRLASMPAKRALREIAEEFLPVSGLRKSVSYTVRELPDGVLGATDKYGRIFISSDLTGDLLSETIRHERVHSWLSPSFLIGLESRANFGQWAYHNSSLLRFLEEGAAESFGKLSLKQGFSFSASRLRQYDLSWGRIGGEAAIYGTGFGSASFIGYFLGDSIWDE